MELDALLKEIKDFADKKALTEALKDVKPIYQAFFNEGHSTATGTLKQEKEDAETKASEAETKLADLQTEFDTFKANKPDTATVDAQWSEKLEKVKIEFRDYKKEVKQEKMDAMRESALSKVHTLLAADIDPEYAESLVQREVIKRRITVDENGKLRILQADKSIPFAGDVDEQVKSLAVELVEGVKPIFRRTAIEAGAGKTETTVVNTIPKGKQKYDAIRESVKSSAKAATADPGQLLDARFGKLKT